MTDSKAPYLYTCEVCRSKIAEPEMVYLFFRAYCIPCAPEREIKCERCEWDNSVPHDSCLYGGNAVGHTKAHCTANACF